MMKLFMVPLAPNPTKVMLYMAEREQLGVVMDIEQIVVNTLKGQHKEPEHLARNPFGVVPTLELDDGTFIRESLSIIEYLEDKYPEHGLISGSPEQKGKLRDIERIVDLRIANPMAGWVHATRSPLGFPPDPERAETLINGMQTALDFLEDQLKDKRPLLAGDMPSIADCTLQAALQFVRFAEADVLGDRPLLRAWDQRYRERPAAKAVLKW